MHDVVVYRMKEMKILTAEMKYMPDQYFDINITLTLSQSHNSQVINNLPREIQTCLRNKTYLSSQGCHWDYGSVIPIIDYNVTFYRRLLISYNEWNNLTLSLNHLVVIIVKNLKCMLYFACRTRGTLLKCGRRLGCFIFSNLVVAKSEKADIRVAYLFSFCLSYILSSMSTCTINMSKCNKGHAV